MVTDRKRDRAENIHGGRDLHLDDEGVWKEYRMDGDWSRRPSSQSLGFGEKHGWRALAGLIGKPRFEFKKL